MATPNNPTGISTGQGKGEAQVFGSTYNPFFKDKLTDAKAKNKEVTDAMAKLSEPGNLWSRDVQSFKPKLDGLRQFYRDNAQKIIKGDFDTTLKLKELQNDASQYITSSKSTEKYANELLKDISDNPDKYSDASRQRVLDFVNQRQAGDFDISKLKLDPKYNVNDSIDALQKSVKNLGQQYGDLRIEETDGVKYLVNESGQLKDEAGNFLTIDNLVKTRLAGDLARYGDEQVGNIWTEDYKLGVHKMLEGSLGETRKTSMVQDFNPWSSGSGKKALESAKKLKKDAFFLQNWTPGKSEGILTNLANKDIVVTHYFSR